VKELGGRSQATNVIVGQRPSAGHRRGSLGR
jgi:hypothetical protein